MGGEERCRSRGRLRGSSRHSSHSRGHSRHSRHSNDPPAFSLSAQRTVLDADASERVVRLQVVHQRALVVGVGILRDVNVFEEAGVAHGGLVGLLRIALHQAVQNGVLHRGGDGDAAAGEHQRHKPTTHRHGQRQTGRTAEYWSL